MISTMRPDIDNIDEYVRNTTARAFAVVASALPWMMTNWFEVSNTAGPGQVPDSVKLSFYWGGAVFLAAVGWTVFRTREYSPEELAAFEAARPAEQDARG